MPPKPFQEVLASGLGCQITDTIFNPLEMLKTRMQLQKIAEREPLPQAVRTVWRRGGLWLLWTPGLQATWVRAYFVTGLRVGLYPTVRGLLGSTGENSGVLGKAAAGMATGALSASLANPIDMVRTRIHGQVASGPQRWASSLAALGAIVAADGVAGLWRGLGATVARQMLLSGGQLASYDQAKQAARQRGVRESTALHMACAALSGVFAQLACMPADVIKAKVLSGDHGRSVLECVRATAAQEGVAGFYRGFLPAVARQCPVILVQMPLIEAIRKAAGLGHI